MFRNFKEKLQWQQEDLSNEDEKIGEVEPDDGRGDASKLLNYVEEGMSRLSVMPSCTCNTKGMQKCQFTQLNNKIVYMGNCIGHSANGSTTYLAMDDDGQTVVAKKWCLPPPNDFHTRYTQLASLEQDFKAIHRLKKSYLVPYAAMERKSESKQTGELLVVFREFIVGVSLKCLQDKCSVFDKFEGIRLLRQVGLGVFSALGELHSVGVLHRDVRSENVFLEDSGGVKLVGASLDSRLSEMVEGDSYCDKQTKAQDIYAAALVLVSIVSKETSQEIPPDLPGSVKDFFSRCLTEDEHCQWSADQLINHGFLTDALVKSPSNTDNEIGESENEDVAKGVQRSISTNLNSRLNDFEILYWLGKGAFGDVLKVQNKLDRRYYALKQVKLNPNSEELNKKITAEVELLSRLNHENVVRYYNAWFESMTEIEGASEAEESSDQDSSPVTTDTNSFVDYLVSYVKAHDDSSSHIQFGEDSDKSQSIPPEDVSASPRVQLRQVLYIQMEFCEKNTLRQAIDNGLYQENFRAWRLFREILEGLAHIHQKGMIHRDLKPMNIFLDFNDNVKIGDFGLAIRVFSGLPKDDEPNGQNEEEMFLTGKVGTALYAAPELERSTKVVYDHKVDMYSLGIILFEMFHAPFDTLMERITVLTSLRDKKVIMPKSFVKPQNSKLRYFIRSLLHHDASRRPTSMALLSSKDIPRVVPEETLSSLLTHTLSKRSWRGYQMVIQGCLAQQLSTAEDFTFTSHQCGMHLKPMKSVSAVQDRVIKVFKSHGAQEFSPPLLTPCSKRWDQNSKAVKVMTSSGAVCHLPFDLRLPFARYIAHSGMEYMRRYVVGRVYRESKRKVRPCHPVEVLECAFDIVTPGDDTLWLDAELLVVAIRAAAECSLKVTVQLNHTDLLRSLLLSCGVPLDKHHTLYPVLVDFSLGLRPRLQLQTHLDTLDVSPDNMKFLFRIMKGENTLKNMQDLALKVPSDQRPRFYEVVNQLCDVIRHAGAYGCECPMTITPSLAYNATQHSGVFWQMSVARQDQRTAKHRSKDLIAAGGRYDALVQEFRKVARGKKDSIVESKSSHVGFSMLLEQMGTILTSLNVELPRTVKGFESPLIAVTTFVTVGDPSYGELATQRVKLVRELWANGYSCITSNHETVDVIITLIPGVDYVRVSCLKKNTWSQEIVPLEDVVQFINRKFNPDAIRRTELGGPRRPRAARFIALRPRPGLYRARLRRVLQSPEHSGGGAAGPGRSGAPE